MSAISEKLVDQSHPPTETRTVRSRVLLLERREKGEILRVAGKTGNHAPIRDIGKRIIDTGQGASVDLPGLKDVVLGKDVGHDCLGGN